MILPLVQEIAFIDPHTVFTLFKNKPFSILLESAALRTVSGRYSFIAQDPFLTLQSLRGKILRNHLEITGNPFDVLQQTLADYTQATHTGLPPFQGGMAGYFSYDLLHALEKIPRPLHDDMHFPDMMLGFYDVVIAFDHVDRKSWIFSSGFPLQEKNARLDHAKKRLEQTLAICTLPIPHEMFSKTICNPSDIHSTFSKKNYIKAVEATKDYILAGDIFEANISQRFSTTLPDTLTPFDLYARLRTINPAPFAAFLNLGNIHILSASPERFLKLTGQHVETRPIKGTSARGHDSATDALFADNLKHSEKDRAENMMIVDLLRNDLSRVCKDHTVEVPQLCEVETYASVHHLVSVVTGELRENTDAIDLIKASFPGGSITGAPKVRAMEIIAELEPTQRGPYCGSIAYIGFDGAMDSSITIRTFCLTGSTLSFQVGGAIVADSDPELEYEETLIKAHALFRALTEAPT